MSYEMDVAHHALEFGDARVNHNVKEKEYIEKGFGKTQTLVHAVDFHF